MATHGEVLRQVMSQTGTTQSELSRISGVKQPSISQFLSGSRQMSDDMLDRLLTCMSYRLEVVRRPLRVELGRSQRRSWHLHRQLSRHLDGQTLQEWTPTMRGNLQRLRLGVQGEPHVGNLQRWSSLIEHGDLAGIRHIMTGVDVDSGQMREVSPMGGLLSQQERDLALEAVSRS